MGKKNNNNNSLKGLSPDVVIVDEAAQVTDGTLSVNNDLEITDTAELDSECRDYPWTPTTPWTVKECIEEALVSIPDDNPFKDQIVRDLKLILTKLD